MEYKEVLNEIYSNTSSFRSFKKRFFRWFNMFQVIKYLNFSHEVCYRKLPVQDAVLLLLCAMQIDRTYTNFIDMLYQLRKIVY